MGKSTISMVIFNSYVKLPEGMIAGSVDVFRSLQADHRLSTNTVRPPSFLNHI